MYMTDIHMIYLIGLIRWHIQINHLLSNKICKSKDSNLFTCTETDRSNQSLNVNSSLCTYICDDIEAFVLNVCVGTILNSV